MRLPKSIIKKYGVTKKAWAVFRSMKGGKKKPAKARRVVVRSKKEDKPMARKKRSVRRAVRRVARRVGVAASTKPGQVVVGAMEAAAGAVVTSVAVNKLPVIKDQSRLVKAGAQGALGIAAVLFLRNRHVKALGAGAVIAAAMSAAKTLFNVEPLAGPSAGSRTLTPSEMALLTSGQMNIPLRQDGRMAMPMSQSTANAGFSRAGFGS